MASINSKLSQIVDGMNVQTDETKKLLNKINPILGSNLRFLMKINPEI